MAQEYLRLYERMIEAPLPFRITSATVPSESEDEAIVEDAA
jgi:hypothetical protein